MKIFTPEEVHFHSIFCQISQVDSEVAQMEGQA